MPAERAGYTVTMFLIDTSPSMEKLRTVELPPGPHGEERTTEMTNLEWALQFVKLKIQEMIFNGRKTDQCGVIVFGSDETNNVINEKNGGYLNVSEYIRIAQPNAGTLAKIDALQPSESCGDPIDALIVGIETQSAYLGNKKTWTRKIIMVTDGESPIEIEDWEATVAKMDELAVGLTVVGVDFDDEEFGYEEPDKSTIKRANEKFYAELCSKLNNGLVGTCAFALQETTRPDIKQTRSTLMGTVLRLGDIDTRSDEALEVIVKTSKCTALSRPKSWKKFTVRKKEGKGKKKVRADGDMEVDEEDKVQDKMEVDVEGTGESEDEVIIDENGEKKVAYTTLKMRTEYYVDRNAEHPEDTQKAEEEDVKMEDDDFLLLDANDFKMSAPKPESEPIEEEEPEESEMEKQKRLRLEEKKRFETMERVEKEDLVRGFKYGTTYAPCPDGQFPRLQTRKGIDICGFFLAKNFRRELSLGEIQYVWADPSSPNQQVMLSSIVQAMYEKGALAIARWVSKDEMDPKMGVLAPCVFDGVDCFLWAHMPFADDVRKYTFASLDNLVSKKGETITEHPYIPTETQQEAMDDFVDEMDLMGAGEKDEEGNRGPWFDTRQSYNPTIHRVKQAVFHAAVVPDIETHPLPPPHPELLKYFDPPRKVLKRARGAIEGCKSAFKVKQVPKRVAKARKDGHEHAQDEEDAMLLLDKKPLTPSKARPGIRFTGAAGGSAHSTPSKGKAKVMQDPSDSQSDTEDDDEDLILNPTAKKPATPSPSNDRNALPTPARSLSPDVDLGRAPGRIIGSTYPLRDFEANIALGDVVSKAVEDMGAVIVEIVMRPFASRRNAELVSCMKKMRDTCLQEDEVDAWNEFLNDLKGKCLAKPGNSAFWEQIQKEGRELSLISKSEANKYGGTSSFTDRQAEEFIQ
ncbi:hypothetical protein BDQ12DRAFT_683054 [Crucibulum laeve]|uniref:ATP-dependent DNA helicase II subunit 2 n=1 Tax=Crucibulum laeve TaxID=68775 RepID=A0A5C3M347_9AGAR|nr:hypothetical protein BDQ12DRAFT_683054 [Crucibulum laeve]